MTLLLALDLGTSSSRAMLYDGETGNAVPGAIHQISHEPIHGPDGRATLDPDALVEELVSCSEKTLALANGAPIAGVGISTFWHSFAGVDTGGNAATPILLWSDQRSTPQVARLRTVMDTVAYSQRTGCPLHTSYLPGRLLWLHDVCPEQFKASSRFVSPGEYLIGKLFGWERVTCSTSMASGTGLLNEAVGGWDEETMWHIPDLTPEHLSPMGDAPVSGLREPYRTRLASIADVPWFPALGDGACSNIGCGATAPGQLALMIGTSGALRVVVPGRVPPPLPVGLFRYRIDSERSIFGGALSNGGSVWAWLKRTIQMPGDSDAAVDAALATLQPDDHGLTVLPFFSGERAPLWRDDLRATITGLSVGTTTLEIVRANLEAVALRFAAVREALRPVAGTTESVVGTGAGLLSSPVWAQMIADAMGETVALTREEQASARGAALWARERLGLGRIEDAPPVEVAQRVAPDPGHTAIYRRARQRQEALLQRLLSV